MTKITITPTKIVSMSKICEVSTLSLTIKLIQTKNPIKKYFHNEPSVIILKYSVFDTLGSTGRISNAYKLLRYSPYLRVDVIYIA